MPSDSTANPEVVPQADGSGLRHLLDSAFGFGVWAVHLLVIYVSTAVACQVGLGSEDAGVQTTVVTTLSVVTIAAAALVAWHATRRYRQQRLMPERGFLARLAVGHDGVAALAILWQLMPLLMVPLCR